MRCECGEHDLGGQDYAKFCDTWRRRYIDRVERWQASHPIQRVIYQVNEQRRKHEAADSN